MEDLTGKRFNRLTVIKRVENMGVQPMWLCRCDCGNETVIRGHKIKHGITKSCGCLVIETITKHNGRHDRLYNIWRGMRRRCYDKSSPKYKNYGERGIVVCSEWVNDYSAFREWAIQHGYDDSAKFGECTLDRINVNGNYDPSNCRFVSLSVQSFNRTDTDFITYNNETKSLTLWAQEYGLKQATLWARLYVYHWDIEKALTTPVRRIKRKNAV